MTARSDAASRWPSVSRTAMLSLAISAVVATSACSFAGADRDRAAGAFSPNPNAGIQSVAPQPPATDNGGGQAQPAPSLPPGPCTDPDPAVIATCLASTSAIAPGDQNGDSAIVAERTTGNILTVQRGAPNKLVATFPVDPSGDGGLLAFAKSPTYDQDQLIYAYISTPTDNRVVRIAPGDTAKPILTGIPKGATGNAGSLVFHSPTELLVSTGDAGNAAAANDPASLAGKLLSVTDLTSGSSTPPKILASGLGEQAAMCAAADGSALYVTDRTDAEDRLQQVAGSGVLRPLWTWPDKPGIAGCAVTSAGVVVTATRTLQLLVVAVPTHDHPTVDKPSMILEKKYGAPGPIDALPNGIVQFGTVNKDVGKPVSTDDRAVKFLVPAQSNSRV